MAYVIHWGRGRGRGHYVIRGGSGVIHWTDRSGTVLVTRPSNVHKLVEPDEATLDHAQEATPVSRIETDWLDSASLFLPKAMREVLLGDLLEERAVWQAAGKSRLSVARWTVSQLILSALAPVWGAGKDLLIEMVRKWLGF